LVERNLAKVEVESSRLFSRSNFPKREAQASLFCEVKLVQLGAIAKRLCNGLQIRLARFDSGSRLHFFSPTAPPTPRWRGCFVCTIARLGPVVKLVDTADLKSAAFLKGGVPVRPRFRAPEKARHESRYNAPFEIHVHGDVKLARRRGFAPCRTRSSPCGSTPAPARWPTAPSAYEEEPGIRFDAPGAPAADVLDGAGRDRFSPVARRNVHEPQRAVWPKARRSKSPSTTPSLTRKTRSAERRVARRLRDAVCRPRRPRPSCRCSVTCWCRTW
jgi:hypothetical protein